jgi:hypothetical protein
VAGCKSDSESFVGVVKVGVSGYRAASAVEHVECAGKTVTGAR